MNWLFGLIMLTPGGGGMALLLLVPLVFADLFDDPVTEDEFIELEFKLVCFCEFCGDIWFKSCELLD